MSFEKLGAMIIDRRPPRTLFQKVFTKKKSAKKHAVTFEGLWYTACCVTCAGPMTGHGKDRLICRQCKVTTKVKKRRRRRMAL